MSDVNDWWYALYVFLPFLTIGVLWGIARLPDREDFAHRVPPLFQWKLAATYPAILGFAVVFGLTNTILFLLLIRFPIDGITRIIIVPAILFSQAGLAAFLLWWFIRYQSGVSLKQYVDPQNRILVSFLWGLRLCLGLSILLTLLWLGGYNRGPGNPDSGFDRGPWWWQAIFFIWMICLVAIEEGIFRGMLFAPLVRKIGPIGTAVVTSLVFALFHPDRILGAFILGLVLGYLYLHSWSLIPPILFHVLWNWHISFKSFVRSYPNLLGIPWQESNVRWITLGGLVLGYLVVDWQLRVQRRKLREQVSPPATP